MCAHQILFQLESEEVKASCEMKYSARTAYTPRELKTREDWNEWQANVLGAAILLPQKEVDLAMRRFAETPLINYEGRYSYGDHLTLRLFCRLFGVSKTTASIRLRQLRRRFLNPNGCSLHYHTSNGSTYSLNGRSTM